MKTTYKVPREKPLGARERTSNNLKPHMASTPGFIGGRRVLTPLRHPCLLIRLVILVILLWPLDAWSDPYWCFSWFTGLNHSWFSWFSYGSPISSGIRCISWFPGCCWQKGEWSSWQGKLVEQLTDRDLSSEMSFGYDEDFVSLIDEDLQCSICYLALREPVLTRCGHRFCRQCLDRHMARFVSSFYFRK